MGKINTKIKLIVGLGNPGEEYRLTRHNIGFIAIEKLAEKFGAPEFKFEKKLNSEVVKANKSLVFAKPQTFMNKSGLAVANLTRFYKIKPENVLTINDDIDILWGEFKLSFGRSSAGHKGVESIIKSLKTKDFWRLRIGIQPNLKKHASAEKIILKKFTPSEIKDLGQTIKNSLSRIEENFGL